MKDSTAPSSLAAEAYEVVKQRILQGELPMGQVISRRKIAAELGMSFLPVSEALLRLEFEGLLESRPRAGTRVRIPSREDVRGHYVVREALEVQAAMLFCSGATSEHRDGLIASAFRVDAMSISDEGLYLPAHEKLHRQIAEGAGCPALSLAIEKTHALASTWFCIARPSPIRLRPDVIKRLQKYWSPAPRMKLRKPCVSMSLAVWRTLWIVSNLISGFEKLTGRLFFRSEKRQKLQLIHPSALN